MASFNLQGFDKISTNVDLMQMIFHYLNFEEQLKLAQVSPDLKYIFCNFIWKVDYTTICFKKQPPDFCVVNETGLDSKVLSSSEFGEFLKVYGEDIKELKETNPPCMDIRHFPNLIALEYGDMTVETSQLQSVAKYCKKLQKLKISSTNQFALDINTILEMKQLKYLSWKSRENESIMMSFNDFVEFVIKSQIKHLSLICRIRLLPMPIKFKKDSANYLEQLDIYAFRNKKWKKKDLTCYYLSNFENLVILTLNETAVDNDAVKVLADTCKKLKKLNFNDTEFKNVTNFPLLNSIEEFNVNNCEGLSQANLRQFLTEMNLKHFSSNRTDFKGIYKNFVISSQIQSLSIDDYETYQFKGAYEMNENLRSLVWYDYGSGAPMQPVSFNCPRLEKLKVVSGFIPIEMLLQLQSLQTLSIANAEELTWTYIIQLLRDHVSLKELKLENDWVYDPLDLDLPPPKEAFSCAENVKSIQISTSIFEIAIHFWLDLIGKNSHVKLVCTRLYYNGIVKNVVNSPKFPNFIKTIYINGFKVAVSDLRNNFNDTIKKPFLFETKCNIIFG